MMGVPPSAPKPGRSSSPARRTRGVVFSSCSLMVVNHQSGRRDHFDGEHHAAVLVHEDMAMHDVNAVVVDEAAAHLEVAAYNFLLLHASRRYGKNIPPDQIGLRRLRPAGTGHRP